MYAGSSRRYRKAIAGKADLDGSADSCNFPITVLPVVTIG
jgi:hypothetical protein